MKKKVRTTGFLRTRLIVYALVAIVSSGCANKNDLGQVAKDWSLTIRASQIFPVYPLTEDLQPGDVFAVAMPLNKQHEEFKKQGFLPLDQLMIRLPNEKGSKLAYEEFYQAAYLAGTYAQVAHDRPMKSGDKPKIPRAAFPSYSFDYNQQVGLQLAIPLQSVPFGIAFMRASHAKGTVSIRDAYTYGVDIGSLNDKLTEWWECHPKIRQKLINIAKERYEDKEQGFYLRVVNRVFLTRGVTVSLIKSYSLKAGLDSEEATPVSPTGLVNLAKPLNTTNSGASVRITNASQRAITMDEDFERPLVIGYLGFDVQIAEELGPPIPSFSLVNKRIELPKPSTPIVISPITKAGAQCASKIIKEEMKIMKRIDALNEKQSIDLIKKVYANIKIPKRDREAVNKTDPGCTRYRSGESAKQVAKRLLPFTTKSEDCLDKLTQWKTILDDVTTKP